MIGGWGAEQAEFYFPTPTPSSALIEFRPFPPRGLLCAQLHVGAQGSRSCCPSNRTPTDTPPSCTGIREEMEAPGMEWGPATSVHPAPCLCFPGPQITALSPQAFSHNYFRSLVPARPLLCKYRQMRCKQSSPRLTEKSPAAGGVTIKSAHWSTLPPPPPFPVSVHLDGSGPSLPLPPLFDPTQEGPDKGGQQGPGSLPPFQLEISALSPAFLRDPGRGGG